MYPGKKIVFVTNNSTKSRTDYQKKLTAMGIPSEIDEIFAEAGELGAQMTIGCFKRGVPKAERSMEHSLMEMAVNSRIFSETQVPTATGRAHLHTKQGELLALVS